ncbi:MAG: family 1 encapsulin nanocompartment shell protein [Acidimicrobiales bacterium]
MNHLLRELAPVPDAAWEQVDEEAKTRLTTYLAGRRLADFSGPHGWGHAACPLGRSETISSLEDGITARLRQVLPMVELHVPFTLSRAELDNAARGDEAIDLAPLDKAARVMALAENRAVFHGYPAAQIRGMTDAGGRSLEPETSWEHLAKVVATAVERLLLSGVGGPYGLALGDDAWVGVMESTEDGGYPLMDHLRQILGGAILWAPGVEGGVVVSQRGGDFRFVSGQDLSVGYHSYDGERVTLFLEESFTFRVLEPDAAIALPVR